MSQNFYHTASFIKSAAKLNQLPSDEGVEVAFVGRSNAGKSSALNALTQQKSLAHVSKMPGRTQLINLFALDEQRRLIDLPGYGFAKVPLSVKHQWQQLLSRYLETRECLQGLMVLMDCRRPLQPLDEQIIRWAQSAQLPCHLLLTKADKLSKSAAQKSLLTVAKQFEGQTLISAQLFSATKKVGLADCYAVMDQWYAVS